MAVALRKSSTENDTKVQLIYERVDKKQYHLGCGRLV